MRNVIMTLGFAVAMPLLALADVSKEEIKKLVAAGISEDVILSYIRTHGPAAPLTADDLVELKRSGAGEKLLASLAGSSTPQAPAPVAPTPSVGRTLTVPSTTMVYDSPIYYTGYPYYSSWYYPGYPYSYSTCYPRYYGWGCYPRYSASFGFGLGRWRR